MARAALIGVALLLAACKSEPTELRIEGETMGTTYHIVALDAGDDLEGAEVKTAVEAALVKVNAQMSNWDPNSEVSKFDARQDTDPVAISPELAKVMAAAAEVNRLSEGQFDVTLGPLIELWGFGARTPETPHPSDAAITAALAEVGQDKVLVLDMQSDPPTLAKSRPARMSIWPPSPRATASMWWARRCTIWA